MPSRLLRRAAVVASMVVVLMLGATAQAKNCTPFGCTPKGNPIEELGGMVVAASVVGVVLYSVARGVVK